MNLTVILFDSKEDLHDVEVLKSMDNGISTNI